MQKVDEVQVHIDLSHRQLSEELGIWHISQVKMQNNDGFDASAIDSCD